MAQNAASVLVALKAEEAVPTLLECLGHSDATVRVAAVWALGQLNAEGALPALIQILLHDPDTEVARRATDALRNLPETAAHPSLVTLLLSGLPEEGPAQFRAIEGLGALRVRSAVPELIQLSVSDPGMAPWVLRALAEIADRSALPFIQACLRSEKPNTRYNAALALANLDGEDVDRILHGAANDLDRHLRSGAREALDKRPRRGAQTRDPAILLALLAGADAYDAIVAAETLGLIKDPDTLPALEKALADRRKVGRQDKDAMTVSEAAAFAIAAFGDLGMPSLKRALASPSKTARTSAVTALEHIGTPTADALLAAAGHRRAQPRPQPTMTPEEALRKAADPDVTVAGPAQEFLLAMGEGARAEAMAMLADTNPSVKDVARRFLQVLDAAP